MDFCNWNFLCPKHKNFETRKKSHKTTKSNQKKYTIIAYLDLSRSNNYLCRSIQRYTFTQDENTKKLIKKKNDIFTEDRAF